MRIFQVDAIDIQIAESEPPLAMITVMGIAATPGYTNVTLKPLEKKLSADGILDLELVGDPPDGIVPQVLTAVTASYTMKEDVNRLVGVMVHARSNTMTQLLAQLRPRFPELTKTLQFGEEGKTPIKGEEGPQTTPFVGEENPGTTPIRGEEGPGKTPIFGEEDPSKTPFKGEETPKTPFFGEEDPGKTPFLGEEDPGKTPFLGEEDPGTTPIKGEETPKTPVFGEEDPGKTPVSGEEIQKTALATEEVFKNPVGEGDPTTLAIGEEGTGKTAPQFEEGPKPTFGETDPRTEGGKPALGETFDPGFRNPFGRR